MPPFRLERASANLCISGTKGALVAHKERNMRRLAILFVATAALSALGLLPADASPGCYRWGETGYHWYRFCFGPAFLYPHQRVCRRGYCRYR